MEARFINKADACKALGVSPATLNRNLKSGSVPSVKLGARVLIPADFIDQLAARALARLEA